MRTVYANGTIAIFRFNGFVQIFQRYEKEPPGFFIDCFRTFGVVVSSLGVATAMELNDRFKSIYTSTEKSAVETLIANGGWWSNCTNGTRFQFGPKIDASVTDEFIKATAFVYDDVFTNGTRRRFFRNGTRAIYQQNNFLTSFVRWE